MLRRRRVTPVARSKHVRELQQHRTLVAEVSLLRHRVPALDANRPAASSRGIFPRHRPAASSRGIVPRHRPAASTRNTSGHLDAASSRDEQRAESRARMRRQIKNGQARKISDAVDRVAPEASRLQVDVAATAFFDFPRAAPRLPVVLIRDVCSHSEK